MIFLAAFLLELLVLFFLSRALTMNLSLLLYRFGFGEKLVMHLLAVLFLPGTFIHEISHYLMSVLLRVRVYSMTLLPKPAEGRYIKMGGIEHAKCDLIRNLFIGSAPFIIGNFILFSLLLYSMSHNPSLQNWVTLVTGFIVFQIGNTMFSSRADMDGSVKLLLILIAGFGLAYLFGWRISLEQLDQSIPGSLANLIKQADLFLGIPIVLDISVIGFVNILSRLFWYNSS